MEHQGDENVHVTVPGWFQAAFDRLLRIWKAKNVQPIFLPLEGRRVLHMCHQGPSPAGPSQGDKGISGSPPVLQVWTHRRRCGCADIAPLSSWYFHTRARASSTPSPLGPEDHLLRSPHKWKADVHQLSVSHLHRRPEQNVFF